MRTLTLDKQLEQDCAISNMYQLKAQLEYFLKAIANDQSNKKEALDFIKEVNKRVNGEYIGRASWK